VTGSWLARAALLRRRFQTRFVRKAVSREDLQTLSPRVPLSIAARPYYESASASTCRRKVEISLADDAVIRFKKAPKQFDDKGKPATPTAMPT
jgi:hypothetical protein